MSGDTRFAAPLAQYEQDLPAIEEFLDEKLLEMGGGNSQIEVYRAFHHLMDLGLRYAAASLLYGNTALLMKKSEYYLNTPDEELGR